MSKEVKWDVDVQIPESFVRKLGEYWNVKFPDKYIESATFHDGAKIKVKNDSGDWKEGIISIPRWHGKYAVVALLKFANADTIEKAKSVIIYNAFKECLSEPEKIFPFAIDGAGNIFFFDYRRSPDEPTVAFLDHERAVTEDDLTDEDLAKKSLGEWLDDNLYPVCNSFSELLELVIPSES